MTNRYCKSATEQEGHSPKGEVSDCGKTADRIDLAFKIDWLTVTVFCELSELAEPLADSVVDQVSPDFGQLADLGPGGQWENRYQGPAGMMVLVPRESRRRAGVGPWVQVEFKGEACSYVGPERMGAFLVQLQAAGIRWHATRVDFAFDGSNVSPALMDKAQREGRIVSPLGGPMWLRNEAGESFYLGHKSPGEKRIPARQLNVYNARGFNRVELRLRREWAKRAGADLVELPPARWVELGRSALRSAVPRVLAAAGADRQRRGKLEPWWDELLSDATPIRLPRRPEKAWQPNALGRAEAFMKRISRGLACVLEGLGDDYVRAALLRHLNITASDSQGRRTAEDLAWVQQLREMRGFAEHLGLIPPSDEDDETPDFLGEMTP